MAAWRASHFKEVASASCNAIFSTCFDLEAALLHYTSWRFVFFACVLRTGLCDDKTSQCLYMLFFTFQEKAFLCDPFFEYN